MKTIDIVGIVSITGIVVFVLISLYKSGLFGLYIEIKYTKQRVYYWYKGSIINSFVIPYNCDALEFRELYYKHKAIAFMRIYRIKQIKKFK